MQIVIPMSGIGKRFREAGYLDPKPLIDVDGYPMIKHVIDLFPNEHDFMFVCNDEHLKNTKIRDILNQLKPGSGIYEVPIGSKKGPVEVVLSIQDEIDDDEEVIVSYCDYGTVWNYQNFLCDVSYRNLDGCIPCYTGFHPHMLGPDHYAYVKHNNKIAIQVQEKKPFTDNKMSEYASNGTYYFKNGAILKKYLNKLVESGKTINNEYYVSMVYNAMIEDGFKVGIFEIQKMLQWGVPNDLQAYQYWQRYFNTTKDYRQICCPPKTTLILPMAGKGSRFESEGYEVPKPLIEVDGIPMVSRAIGCLPVTDKMVFGCLQEHIFKNWIDVALRAYHPTGQIVPINYVTEGQACTCERIIQDAQIDISAPILISACDNGASYNKNELEVLLNDESIDIIVWSFRNNQTSKNSPNSYAWLGIDENNFIKNVSCKKFIYDDPLRCHAIIGTMFFRKASYFLDGLKQNYDKNFRTNGEFYVDDVLNRNIDMGLKVKVFEVDHYICWGAPDDLRVYNYWKEHFEH